MKTPDEIKKGLECCILETDDTSLVDHCRVCPYQPTTGLCLRTLFKDALAYIKQLEAAQPRWISVEERLPNRKEKVVVIDGKHTWDYGEFSGLGFSDGNPHKWNWKKNTIRNVEWWMPKETALPDALKEGE